MFSLSI